MKRHTGMAGRPATYPAVQRHIAAVMPRLERSAARGGRRPHLAVGYGATYPNALFCWDHFFMALRFAEAGRPEYLRHGTDILLDHQRPNGFVPNVVRPGIGPASPYHAQPFLAQSALLYAVRTGDLAWARGRWAALAAYLAYYERRCRWPSGLFSWAQPHASGVDNDAATAFFPSGTVVTPDLNAWLVLEYRAAAALAARLGRARAGDRLAAKARRLRDIVNARLWHAQAGTYAAGDGRTGALQLALEAGPEHRRLTAFAFQSCSNLIPLYARLAPRARARRMIASYVLDARHFWSPFGIRSLSRASPFYNNAVWGNPPRFGDPRRMTNSNWQGPVWFPLCYFMVHALRHYGCPRAARELADRTLRLLARALRRRGSWAENYDAETGRPLYADRFASWTILADRLHPDLESDTWIMDPVFESY